MRALKRKMLRLFIESREQSKMIGVPLTSHLPRYIPLERNAGRHCVHIDWLPESFGIRSKNLSHFSSTDIREGVRKTSVCNCSQPSVTHSIALFSPEPTARPFFDYLRERSRAAMLAKALIKVACETNLETVWSCSGSKLSK